jgi:hydrogenase nickel incorporation protein HypA/HybF
MHEYSIVQALLDRVDVEARSRQAVSVARVRLAIGRMAGVESELLRSAFEIARAGTCCAEAELEVRDVEPRWSCRECGQELAVGALLRCPACGAAARLAAGDEIVLESLELEVA